MPATIQNSQKQFCSTLEAKHIQSSEQPLSIDNKAILSRDTELCYSLSDNLNISKSQETLSEIKVHPVVFTNVGTQVAVACEKCDTEVENHRATKYALEKAVDFASVLVREVHRLDAQLQSM